VVSRGKEGEGMSDDSFRRAIVALLSGILLVLILVLQKLPRQPVTIATILATPQNEKAELIKRLPLVRIHGPVNVNVENMLPIPVEIQ
jgi:hypothetical protein